MRTGRRCRVWVAVVVVGCIPLAAAGNGEELSATHDPVTRYVNISYPVPADAPDEVLVSCSWRPADGGDWHVARVLPLVSDTALLLATDDDWNAWTAEGKVLERRAAGLRRTVVFNPYPDAQREGRVDIEFRVRVATLDGVPLAEHTGPI
ncbi:MAG: hypothetical protein GY851_23965, partial [bacterium]|nr:hypothetical protein [bacterium]